MPGAYHGSALPDPSAFGLRALGPSEGRTGTFGRLFAGSPPLVIDPDIIHHVGAPGGPMEDATPPALASDTPAGLIFFGQFIDHDVTLDVSSSLDAMNDPQEIGNVRTPTLDLDCVYGAGREAHGYLFKRGSDHLMTGADYPASMMSHVPHWHHVDDLPRTPDGVAIIGDHRNDENRVISQIQLGFLRFHNRVVDTGKGFEEARRIVRWHYQWIVVNEFLRTLCGNYVIDDILSHGRRVYRPDVAGEEPYIPIEFAAAGYRFGHSMIPHKLRIRQGASQHDLFGPDSVMGKGFEPVTSIDGVVEWSALLDDGSGTYERAHQLDAKLAPSLLDLPFIPDGVASLATRNMLRAQSFGVPSGEEVARVMRDTDAREILPGMVDAVSEAAQGMGFAAGNTPLWPYILLEGKVVGRLSKDRKAPGGPDKYAEGEGLGPVGARLVAEVLIGLLQLDPRSYLGSRPDWTPMDAGDQVGPGVDSLYKMLTAS